MTKFQLHSKGLLWSTYLGNFFEHYDTTLYAFLSVFLAPLLFPGEDQITGLILMYAIIPLGMLVRPIGAVFFGYIGDNYGRQQALFFTLGGMSIVSGLIALSPTYSQAGMFAPMFFCLGRLMQNFFAAGEAMGGAILLLENADDKRHDILSSLFSTSTIGGIILASAGVSLFGYYNGIESGWRLLYFIGCITALFGVIIRRQTSPLSIKIPPAIPEAPLLSLSKTIFTYRKVLCLIAIGSGFNYANYSIALVLMNGFIPLVSSFTNSQMIALNTLLLVFDFCTLPFFGWLASKVSREKVMLCASISIVLTGIPLVMLVPHASFTSLLLIRVCLVTFGVAFCAPFHAWAQKLVPQAHRYTIISLGYALGSQLLGGPTAALS
jgi:MHS family proline/betaine transporter-like MFS transporter